MVSLGLTLSVVVMGHRHTGNVFNFVVPEISFSHDQERYSTAGNDRHGKADHQCYNAQQSPGINTVRLLPLPEFSPTYP